MKKPWRRFEKHSNPPPGQRRKRCRFSTCWAATLEMLGRMEETLEAYRWIRREDPDYRDVAAAHSTPQFETMVSQWRTRLLNRRGSPGCCARGKACSALQSSHSPVKFPTPGRRCPVLQRLPTQHRRRIFDIPNGSHPIEHTCDAGRAGEHPQGLPRHRLPSCESRGAGVDRCGHLLASVHGFSRRPHGEASRASARNRGMYRSLHASHCSAAVP